MMKIINKNEVTILVIALMLVTAGYLDYMGKNQIDETVSTDTQVEESVSTDVIESEEIGKTGDAKLVNSNQEEDNEIKNTGDSYFASAKLERSSMYSQMIENYQSILENTSITAEQKSIATQEIEKINKIQNAIMISENLLLSKGFDKCVIFVNDESVSVIIGRDEISQEEIAQIQNIIERELGANVDNIHISKK